MANASIESRVLFHDKYHDMGYVNEHLLANALATKPDKINPVLTHLMGREDKKFPLTFLTEGMQGGVKPIEIQDVEYYWDVFGRMKKSSRIVSHNYGSGDKPGINGTPIIIVMEDQTLIRQHTVKTPNGTQLRVDFDGIPVNGGNYQFSLRLIDPNITYVDLAELTTGTSLTMMGGATVSQSGSMGNKTNFQTPGKMKNQISIQRKSIRWEGNMDNRLAEVQFNLGGKTTSYFMPFFRWQATLEWKQSCEEHYWTSIYNRKADGTIDLIDQDTNKPIPIGAGIQDQIPNRETVGTLTANRLKNVVGDVMYGATDIGAMNIVLYTGKGGMRDFDEALKTELKNYTVVDTKMIEGAGRSLVYGSYFATYRHVDGHTISLAHLPMLDDLSGYAQNAPPHYKTGFPITSHDMYFLDQSTYDGVPNVRMITQKGRSMVTGLVKGMAALGQSEPSIDFQGNNFEMLSSEQDAASIHFLSAKGININRNTHCFWLQSDASL